MRFDRRTVAKQSWIAETGPRSRPELPIRWGEYPCAALSDEIEQGYVRGFFSVAGNPVRAFPERERFERALRSLDLLVVSDVVHTETSALATHVLPSTGQLERSDLTHFTDQFQPGVAAQYTPAVVPPGAERRPLWWQFCQLGARLGHDLLPEGLDLETCVDDDLLDRVAARGRSSFQHLVAHPSGVLDESAVYDWVTDTILPSEGWNPAAEALVAQLAALATPPRLVLTPRRQLRVVNSQLTDAAMLPDGTGEVAVLVNPLDAHAAG